MPSPSPLMHEIEIKTRLDHPEATEQRLLRFADFSSFCVKNDQYWTIGDKTIRIRQETVNKHTAIFITQKIKQFSGALESNQELEFELPAAALPVFTAILENTGFVLTAQKLKKTKRFLPHKQLFEQELTKDIQVFSAEISEIEPLGTFLEIEVLYAEHRQEAAKTASRLRNAHTIIDKVLSLLDIPHSAIEVRPYNELLQRAGLANGTKKHQDRHSELERDKSAASISSIPVPCTRKTE